ncbi:MAG: hypothetical protein US97_C0039G0008 [Microgenomates group bacterium GW2011_GWF1_38_5]|nr:MAG: hypothetical protein US97_C0039G0008 [Microgenomates group bacterium GW2011_GWF1_38_5]
MAATIGTQTLSSVWRNKYRSAIMQSILKKALVAEKICEVDRSNSFYIHNPYSNRPVASVAAVDGSYAITAWTTTEDTLTVTDEVTYGEHIYDFERLLSNYDLFRVRTEEQSYAVALAIDKFVLNNLLEAGNQSYTTPAGGFTTAANINVIISNLVALVSGYADMYKGLFLVVQNTDIPGIFQAQMSSGFSFADLALNNGFATNYGGVDIYVVRTGTFDDQTTTTISGSTTWSNDGRRVFGVKGVSTYAQPGGLRFEEKGVTLKTGVEFATYGYVGFKLWAQKTDLVVDILIA